METIIKALELTLLEIIEALKARPPEPLRPYSAAEFADLPLRSRDEEMIKKLADPDEHREATALLTLRWLGERLYEEGGTKTMQAALAEAAGRHPKCEGRMLSIADSGWNHIGIDSTRGDVWLR